MEKQIRLSTQQIGDMKHAIGNKVSKNPYRNYFNTGTPDPSWEELVLFGLATRRDNKKEMGGVYYHLTEKGIEWICEVLK